VKRVPATANQIEDSIQPALASGNLECRARCESEGTQTGNVSEIEGLERPIIRNVEEHAIFFNEWRSVWLICEHSVRQSAPSDQIDLAFSDRR